MSDDILRVRKIREGTVIDHIPDGKAPIVLKLLGITGRERWPVSFVMHVESKRMGRKDIVKVEHMYLDKRLIDNIALVAPSATINIVEDYRITEKREIEVPQELVGILRCPNQTCITNVEFEHVKSLFELKGRNPLCYVCVYCDRLVGEEEIPRLLG
jgi:aspartate carbamoyltransferase regulatory subunit